jgi:hypothetical protein
MWTVQHAPISGRWLENLKPRVLTFGFALWRGAKKEMQ